MLLFDLLDPEPAVVAVPGPGLVAVPGPELAVVAAVPGPELAAVAAVPDPELAVVVPAVPDLMLQSILQLPHHELPLLPALQKAALHLRHRFLL